MSFKQEKKDRSTVKDIPESIATTQQPRKGSTEQALVPIVLENSPRDDEAKIKRIYEEASKSFFQGNYKDAILLLKRCTSIKLEDNGQIAEATAVLGFCFEFGLGIKQDFIMAEKYYILAASSRFNVGLAFCRLAFLRYYGRPNVVIDRSEAEEWKRKAIAIGKKATLWFDIAANVHKIPSANYSYGVCFHDGVGVEKSPETAIFYYKRAAAMGDPRGEATLGYCYGEGTSVHTKLILIKRFRSRKRSIHGLFLLYEISRKRRISINV
jgi:TPR repeat protein